MSTYLDVTETAVKLENTTTRVSTTTLDTCPRHIDMPALSPPQRLDCSRNHSTIPSSPGCPDRRKRRVWGRGETIDAQEARAKGERWSQDFFELKLRNEISYAMCHTAPVYSWSGPGGERERVTLDG